MADIFISYRRSDSARAKLIADALGRLGFDVWRATDAGDEAQARAEARRNLEQAKAVLVLWGASSVTTKRVLQEAASARSRGALVQAQLVPVPPPDGYEAEPIFDLSGWDGDRSDATWLGLVARLKAAAGHRTSAGRLAMDRRTLMRSWKRFIGALLALISLVGGLQTFGIVDVAELLNPSASAEQVGEWKAVRASRDCGRIRTYLTADLSGPFADEARGLLEARREAFLYRWQPFEQSMPATGVSPQGMDGNRALACTAARAAAETTARENCDLFRGAAGDRRNLVAAVPGGDCDCRNALGYWQCSFSATAQCKGEQRVEYKVEVCGE
jgi:hypothetical protein